MADTTEKKWVDYKDDPAGYNIQCVEEWRKWFDKFSSRIEENTGLVNNYSQELADRKEDETFSRSALFVPVINPAVYARAANLSKLVWSVKEPIRAIPQSGTPQQIANNVNDLVDDVLTRDDFQMTYIEQKLAQEQYPIAFLKVCEYEETEKRLELKPDYSYGIEDERFLLGIDKVWEEKKKGLRPTVELFTQEDVFYDPNASKWDEVRYIGTISYLTLGELVSRKKSMGYKFEISELKQKGKLIGETVEKFRERIATVSAEETKEDIASPNKYEVIENFHIVESPEGKIYSQLTVSCGILKLKDVPYPYEKLKIPDPFIRLIGYPVLKRIEGNTTTDFMKHIQHALNDSFNLKMDYEKYNLFPPVIKDHRITIVNDMEIAPGAVWDAMVPADGVTTVQSGFKQLYNVSPTGKDFFVLVNMLREIAEVVGNSQESLTGATTDPEEKATKTKLRAQAAGTRLTGISLLIDVQVLKNLGRIIWTMVLERLGVGEKYKIDQGFDQEGNPITLELGLDDLNGDLVFDVPHLSGLAERETKIEKLQKLFAIIAGLGIAHPLMLKVIYGFLSKFAELDLVKEEFDEIFPPQVIDMIMQPQPMMPGAGGGAPQPPTGGMVPTQLLNQGGI